MHTKVSCTQWPNEGSLDCYRSLAPHAPDYRTRVVNTSNFPPRDCSLVGVRPVMLNTHGQYCYRHCHAVHGVDDSNGKAQKHDSEPLLSTYNEITISIDVFTTAEVADPTQNRRSELGRQPPSPRIFFIRSTQHRYLQ